MAIQLSHEQHDQIKKILNDHLSQAQYYLFGSRVKGTAKPYSDLDIAVVANEAIPLATLSLLKEAFSESNIPFKIDIVDWYRISDEFRQHIQLEWVKLD